MDAGQRRIAPGQVVALHHGALGQIGMQLHGIPSRTRRLYMVARDVGRQRMPLAAASAPSHFMLAMRCIGALLAVAFLLGGCAGGPLVYNEILSPAYRPTEYGYGAGRRDFTTVIVGDPFQLGEKQFQEQFTALLNRNQPILQPTHFTTTPGPSARPAYRVVFLFDRKQVLSNQVCAAPAEVPAVDLGKTVRVIAVFCRFQGYLSSVTGEVEATSIDDPKFQSMISQMIWLLFPPVDPSEDDVVPWLVARDAPGSISLGGG